MFESEYDAIRQHAESEAPNECCGVIVSGVYVPFVNVSDNKLNSFQLDPKKYAAVVAYETIQAVVHSHIHPHEDSPTKLDMEQQIKTKVPWGIVHIKESGIVSDPFWFGDEAPTPPLMGREFRYGVTDCYALARDWYRQKMNISLPNFPRENYWWDRGEDVLMDNYTSMGFYNLPGVDDLRVGDAILGNISGKITNHCGVYVGDGLLLHHLPERLSRMEPIGKWLSHVRVAARYPQ